MTAKIKTSIRQLRDRLEHAKLQVAVKKAEKRTKYLESAIPGDYVQPREIYCNGNRPFAGAWGPRGWGDSNAPGSINLDAVRHAAQWLCLANPTAIGILRGLRGHVLGLGFKHWVKPEPEVTVDAASLRIVQRFLRLFVDECDFGAWEKDFFVRGVRDGECYVWVLPTESGVAEIRTINPDDIKAPPEHPEDIFGVRTVPGDTHQVIGYWINGELIDASEIVALKRNVDRGTRRGLSDFFCTEDALNNISRLSNTAAKGQISRQRIAYFRQWTNATLDQVNDSLSDEVDYIRPTIRGNGSVQDQSYQFMTDDVAVEDVPDQMEAKEPPKGDGTSAKNVLEILAASIAIRWNAQASMISGSSGGSFSSDLIAESPYVKTCEQEQQEFGRFFRDILWKVLEIAEDAGIIPPILNDIDLNFSAPSVPVRDKLKENQTNKLLHDEKILSRKTWSGIQNYDWEQERANFAEEEAEVPATPGPSPTASSDSASAQREQLAPRSERPAD